MKQRGLALGVTCLLAAAWAAQGVAGGSPMASGECVILPNQPCDVKAGLGGQFVFFSPGVVIIETTPPEAEVWLDGLSVGSAGQRVARAFSSSPGLHTVQVAAPGFRPFSARFIVATSFPTRIRVALTPK